jgi:hypothetical protein
MRTSGRLPLLAVTAVLATASGACAQVTRSPAPASALPTPTAPGSAIPATQSPGVSRDAAISIAREAAAAVHSWLRDAPVSFARHDRFADVRNTFAPQVSPPPPDDLPVWTIGLFDDGSGQGATVIVDAADGRVLQVVTYIT